MRRRGVRDIYKNRRMYVVTLREPAGANMNVVKRSRRDIRSRGLDPSQAISFVTNVRCLALHPVLSSLHS